MTKETAKCKNIFKNKADEAIKNAFTSKWIEIINRMEKDRKYPSKP